MTGAPTVALYGHWICPFVTRVRFALAQRGIEFELVNVPPSALRDPGFVLPPEFLEHSPKLEVPMVRLSTDGTDRYLADSIPILEWLEVHVDAPSLLPENAADLAFVRARMVWLDRHVFWPMGGVYHGTDPAEIRRAAEKLHAALADLNPWLQENAWLAGDVPTLAEAVYLPFYVRLDGLRRLGFTHPLPPFVELHRQRCKKLAGWSSVAWNAEQTSEFVGRFEAHRAKVRHA